MKGAIVSNTSRKASGSALFYFLVNFLFEPFKSGVYGFAAFFTILICTKGFSYFIGLYDEYVIGNEDVLFSLLGFILVYMIKLLENIRGKTRS